MLDRLFSSPWVSAALGCPYWTACGGWLCSSACGRSLLFSCLYSTSCIQTSIYLPVLDGLCSTGRVWLRSTGGVRPEVLDRPCFASMFAGYVPLASPLAVLDHVSSAYVRLPIFRWRCSNDRIRRPMLGRLRSTGCVELRLTACNCLAVCDRLYPAGCVRVRSVGSVG